MWQVLWLSFLGLAMLAGLIVWRHRYYKLYDKLAQARIENLRLKRMLNEKYGKIKS